MADKKKVEAPKVEKIAETAPEPKKVVDDAPQGKTIDERMADLEADLKAMGAR